MSEARTGRSRSGVGDMLRSVALLLVPILAFVGYQGWVRVTPDPAPAVDYASAASAVRRQAPFPVLAPAALPAQWRATSVRYTAGPDAHWHLGVLTAAEDYIGLEQVADDLDDAVTSFAPDTAATGSVTIAGQQWQLRTSSARDETALVRQDGDVSTVVIGTAAQAELVAYVETLRS